MSDSVERALSFFEEQPPQVPPELATEARRFAAVSERALELFDVLLDEPIGSTYITISDEGRIPCRVFSPRLLSALALRDAGVDLQLADNVLSAQGNPTGYFTITAAKQDANLVADFLINNTLYATSGSIKLSYFLMRALASPVEIPTRALRPGTDEHTEIAESLSVIPEDHRAEIVKRGFMTNVVIEELRNPISEITNNYWLDHAAERQTAYRILYSQGFKPLGLEELMGLTKRAIDEECMDVPELGARLAAVRSRGRLN